MERLKHRSDFLAAAGGAKAPAAAFVLQARDRGDAGAPRVGFTVTRKIGTAVERNRARRRLREVVRRSDAASLQRGKDYVLVARAGVLNVPFDRLVADFAHALARVHRHEPGRAGGGKAKGRQTAAGGQSVA
jgi:ribonuclease P protein component